MGSDCRFHLALLIILPGQWLFIAITFIIGIVAESLGLQHQRSGAVELGHSGLISSYWILIYRCCPILLEKYFFLQSYTYLTTLSVVNILCRNDYSDKIPQSFEVHPTIYERHSQDKHSRALIDLSLEPVFQIFDEQYGISLFNSFTLINLLCFHDAFQKLLAMPDAHVIQTIVALAPDKHHAGDLMEDSGSFEFFNVGMELNFRVLEGSKEV